MGLAAWPLACSHVNSAWSSYCLQPQSHNKAQQPMPQSLLLAPFIYLLKKIRTIVGLDCMFVGWDRRGLAFFGCPILLKMYFDNGLIKIIKTRYFIFFGIFLKIFTF